MQQQFLWLAISVSEYPDRESELGLLLIAQAALGARVTF